MKEYFHELITNYEKSYKAHELSHGNYKEFFCLNNSHSKKKKERKLVKLKKG